MDYSIRRYDINHCISSCLSDTGNFLLALLAVGGLSFIYINLDPQEEIESKLWVGKQSIVGHFSRHYSKKQCYDFESDKECHAFYLWSIQGVVMSLNSCLWCDTSSQPTSTPTDGCFLLLELVQFIILVCATSPYSCIHLICLCRLIATA